MNIKSIIGIYMVFFSVANTKKNRAFPLKLFERMISFTNLFICDILQNIQIPFQLNYREKIFMTHHKILVVDDEAFIADMSRMTLGDIGHDVSCAYSGEQAVEMAMQNHFDLALVDAMLPGMTGIETFEAIRQIAPSVIGILVTGHVNTDMVIEAMNKGISGVLQKPLKRLDLIQAVREAFATAELREEDTRQKTLLPLYKLGDKFITANSQQEVYDLLLEAVSLQIDAPILSLMMFDEEDTCLHIVASRGMDESVVAGVAIKPGDKIAGWVYEQGKPVILNKKNQANSPLAHHLKRDNITAAMSFPLNGRGKKYGVLNVSETAKGVEYNQSDIEMLSVICGHAVMALENVLSLKNKNEA
jgi:adenylate cyclase